MGVSHVTFVFPVARLDLLRTVLLGNSAVVQNILQQRIFSKTYLLLDSLKRRSYVAEQTGAGTTSCGQNTVFIVSDAVEVEVGHAVCEVACVVAEYADTLLCF